MAIDATASHGNWFENFPWTRLSHAESPNGSKPMIDRTKMPELDADEIKHLLIDGSYGGGMAKTR